MSRIDPFADIMELPAFEPKPKPPKPVVEKETIDKIAQDAGFPSRQPRKAETAPAVIKRKRRTYTTGRNQQINFKATAETIERFYKMADVRGIPLCELLEEALDALDHKTEPNK